MSGAPAILVTDGDERSALATTRSLVAAGYAVHVTAPRERTLAGVSRGATSVVVRADALADPAGFAAEIGRAATDCAARLVVPVTDASVESLLTHRDFLPPSVQLPLPDLATWRLASDKIAMIDRARLAGLDVPASVLVASKAQRDAGGAPALFPAVLKPHRSVLERADGSRLKLGVSFADDIAEYHRVAGALPEEAYPLLVQRRVRGPGEGLFALRWGGRILAWFAHRRLREKPPAGGVSVYRESIEAPGDLLASATRMLDDLDWQGVAMIECKRDLDTGRHVFMEVNGRLWGSLQLAIDAGVNFPVLLVAAAMGTPVPPFAGYRAGVRSRWFWGDMDHLYLRLAKSPRSMHLGADAPSRLRVLRDVLSVGRRNEREEVWRWSDPYPFVLESARRLNPFS